MIAVVDGLKGFSEAINAVLPETTIQTCIVHLVRDSLAFSSYRNRKYAMNKALLSRFLVAPKTGPSLSLVSPFAIDCDKSAGSGREAQRRASRGRQFRFTFYNCLSQQRNS